MKRRIIYENTNDGKLIEKSLKNWKRPDNDRRNTCQIEKLV